MSTLAWIIAASVAGALLSVISAAAVALRASANQLPMLISYAIGALLGAVFLEILPHALEAAGSAHRVAAVILLHSGYSKARAFAFNLISSGAALVGGLLAYFALRSMQDWVPTLLGLAAASMLYVSVADLIPGLHRRPELRATLEQVALISLGIGSIALVRFFVSGVA